LGTDSGNLLGVPIVIAVGWLLAGMGAEAGLRAAFTISAGIVVVATTLASAVG
jgi:hypothetical protein